MNDFDRAARYTVKADAPGMLRWFYPQLSPSLVFSRWLDSQSAPRPGEPDRRCDTIAELVDQQGRSPPRAAVLELFTGADSDADDLVFEYLGRFRRELRTGPHLRDRYVFVPPVLLFLTDGPAVAG